MIASVPVDGATSVLRNLVRDAAHLGRRMLLVSMPVDCRLQGIHDCIRMSVSPGCCPSDLPFHIRNRYLARELKRFEIAAIAIDGGENLLFLTEEKRRTIVDGLAAFASTHEIPLVLVVPPELVAEITHDYDPERYELPVAQQIYNERQAFLPFYLPRLRVDENYVVLLDLWERSLPLRRASHIARRDLALYLYAASDGCYGPLTSVLRRTAAVAIRSGVERITLDLLDEIACGPAPTFRHLSF